MNRALLSGRLARDVEVRHNGENVIARITLAVDRIKKGEVDFIPCVAFGKTAEILERYSGKGKRVCVEGRIQVSEYTTKEGAKARSTEIVVERAEIIDFAQAEDKPKEEAKNNDGFYDALDDEGLPFD